MSQSYLVWRDGEGQETALRIEAYTPTMAAERWAEQTDKLDQSLDPMADIDVDVIVICLDNYSEAAIEMTVTRCMIPEYSAEFRA